MQIEAYCKHCDTESSVELEPTFKDCVQVFCPNCGEKIWVSAQNPEPLHLIVSDIDGYTAIKTNRPVPASRVKSMIGNVQILLQEKGANFILDPEESALQVFIMVDNENPIREDRL